MSKRKKAAKKGQKSCESGQTGSYKTRQATDAPTKIHDSAELKYARPRSVEKFSQASAKRAHKDSDSRSFTVTVGGKQKDYVVKGGYGYFTPSLKRARNLFQVNELVEAGILFKEVEPIIEYLDLKVPEIARAAAVSPSTVSRWDAGSSIGMSGSNQFFRMDEVIRKGVDLFGGPEEFKNWLQSPNMALGYNAPSKLLTSHIGVEMVDEALDALHYGNVM